MKLMSGGTARSLQRWVSIDPTGFSAGDRDLYRFVANGPADTVDPTGLGPLRRRFRGRFGRWIGGGQIAARIAGSLVILDPDEIAFPIPLYEGKPGFSYKFTRPNGVQYEISGLYGAINKYPPSAGYVLVSVSRTGRFGLLTVQLSLVAGAGFGKPFGIGPELKFKLHRRHRRPNNDPASLMSPSSTSPISPISTSSSIYPIYPNCP